jgi:hypothetical protein
MDEGTWIKEKKMKKLDEKKLIQVKVIGPHKGIIRY